MTFAEWVLIAAILAMISVLFWVRAAFTTLNRDLRVFLDEMQDLTDRLEDQHGRTGDDRRDADRPR